MRAHFVSDCLWSPAPQIELCCCRRLFPIGFEEKELHAKPRVKNCSRNGTKNHLSQISQNTEYCGLVWDLSDCAPHTHTHAEHWEQRRISSRIKLHYDEDYYLVSNKRRTDSIHTTIYWNKFPRKEIAKNRTATSLPKIRRNRVYSIQIKYRRRLITLTTQSHKIVIFDVSQTKTRSAQQLSARPITTSLMEKRK